MLCPVPHLSQASICMNNPQVAFFRGFAFISKSLDAVALRAPTLTIFTQVWTTNSTAPPLLPYLNTLPCISVSPKL